MGGTEMPIRRYVENGVIFTPKALTAMSKALEATTEILGIGRDEVERRAVAKFIIRVAKEDPNLEAETLRDRAVAALGGAAYRDPLTFRSVQFICTRQSDAGAERLRYHHRQGLGGA